MGFYYKAQKSNLSVVDACGMLETEANILVTYHEKYVSKEGFEGV